MEDNSKIWLSPPHIEAAERIAISDLIDSNWVTTGGPSVDVFEEKLKEYLEIDHSVIALNSGTSAIHLALLLAGVTRGDSVMCQTMSFIATANPILYIGAEPVFIDSEKETWNMCPQLLEKAIKNEVTKHHKKPAAIIVVHSYGMPCRINEIVTISQKYGIPLIEDAAESLGSTYGGFKCGVFGDFATFSFNGNKIITTGSGGALVVKDKKLAKKGRHISNQAKTGDFDYNHDQLGFNYRMSSLSVALGIAQIDTLDEKVRLRRRNNEFYKSVFAKIEGVTFLEEPSQEYNSNFWLTTILIDNNKMNSKVNNEVLLRSLLDNNIESRMLWKPIHMQSFYSGSLVHKNGVAEGLYRKGLCLPSGSNLNLEQKERIKNVILTTFDNGFN